MMKLLKKVALLSLCVFALSGCTKSSVTTNAPIQQGQNSVVIDGKEMDDREYS